MRKIKHWLNYHEFPSVGEVNDMPSLTVPDETMSIREILVRYAKGLPLGGAKVEIWEGEDNDLPDIRTLDISERAELAEIYTEEIKSIRKASKKTKKDENENKPNTVGEDQPADQTEQNAQMAAD